MDESKDPTRRAVSTGIRRRDFLRLGAIAATGLLVSPLLAATRTASERSLSLYNTHTGEELTAIYWAEGRYIEAELRDINILLRDHRSGDVHSIDTDLLDLLFALQSAVGGCKAYQVISGYRSPATNAALRKRSSGVSKRSYHMQGKAIDIRLRGCDLKMLHKAALDLQAGGVGYYPDSEFIHVDVGPCRCW